MDRLDDAGRTRLRAEEATGGAIDMVDIPSCRLAETIRRRLTLEALLQ